MQISRAFFRLWEEKSLAVVASPKLICELSSPKRITTAVKLQDIQLVNLPQGLHTSMIYVNDQTENKIEEMFL